MYTYLYRMFRVVVTIITSLLWTAFLFALVVVVFWFLLTGPKTVSAEKSRELVSRRTSYQVADQSKLLYSRSYTENFSTASFCLVFKLTESDLKRLKDRFPAEIEGKVTSPARQGCSSYLASSGGRRGSFVPIMPDSGEQDGNVFYLDENRSVVAIEIFTWD